METRWPPYNLADPPACTKINVSFKWPHCVNSREWLTSRGPHINYTGKYSFRNGEFWEWNLRNPTSTSHHVTGHRSQRYFRFPEMIVRNSCATSSDSLIYAQAGRSSAAARPAAWSSASTSHALLLCLLGPYTLPPTSSSRSRAVQPARSTRCARGMPRKRTSGLSS